MTLPSGSTARGRLPPRQRSKRYGTLATTTPFSKRRWRFTTSAVLPCRSWTLLAPQRLAVADRTRIDEVDRLLTPLRDADREFVDELEPLMEDVPRRLRTINDHVQETE
jgi:hypothetical protein